MTVKATQAELEAARGYEALFVPSLFATWSRHVIAAAEIDEGDRVLDVACGTGILARQALTVVGPSGRIVGNDPAAGMLAVAAEIAPAIDWVPGPAEKIGLPDAAFDCVVSQFGMMFFQDRAKAAAEMARVLVPGGRLAVAIWDEVGANPVYAEVAALLDDTVGQAAGDALRLPFSLPLAEASAAIKAAGFQAVTAETLTEQARFPSLGALLEAELRGWLPLFGIVLDEPKIAQIMAQAEKRLARYAVPGGAAAFPTQAHVLRARGPG